jgi:hypothetical protein
MFERRQLITWSYAIAGWVGGWILILGPLMALRRHLIGPSAPASMLMAGAAIVGIAWAFACAWLMFRRLDEFQQTASKFAWYWGGVMGLAVSLPIYMFVILGGLHLAWPVAYRWGLAPAHAFALGYGLPVVLQLLGFFAARVWWRLSKQ